MRYILDTNRLFYLIKNKPESVAKRVNNLAENVILVTHNTKEFERIKGLQFEDWVG